MKSRGRMESFWKVNSRDTSSIQMMLDNNADELGESDIPEILDLLPSGGATDILELGAGIGRFTGHLAESANSVIAVDFMESFVEKNRQMNGSYSNITFRQEDVTNMSLADNSVDMIFSNWLLMYLNDEEMCALGQKMLRWLRNDGHLFFRESCFHKSGNLQVDSLNPTHYRTPSQYTALLSAVSIPDETQTGSYGFDIIFCKTVETYVKMKNNPNQRCWLMHKVHRDTAATAQGFHTFQTFLDQQQYTRNSILRYERIFGRHFVSTGGKQTTAEFVNMLDLKRGEKVLDVGCGIGGGPFYMAEKFDVNVIGIDLSDNMIVIALERLAELNEKRVQFELSDATKRTFAANSFDIIYSRDTILHIKDKKSLFANFWKWLRPGGRLLISDYCCSEGEHHEAFKSYVQQRAYHLLSPRQYGEVLESVGFTSVIAEDRTEQFLEILQTELTRTEEMRDDYIKEFSLEDYTAVTEGWQDKLYRCGLGDQRWGLFRALKPPTVD